MQANEMTFGIEIECTMPANRAPIAGGYHSGLQIAGLPLGWNAQRDGSIRPTRGHVGLEVVSPVLKGADGIEQIHEVCQWLKQIGAKVNESTGFHVHIGWTSDNAALGRLVHIVANHEKAIYASTGTKTRERSNYCRPIANDARYQSRFVQGETNTSTDRYHSLNLTNLPNHTNKRTVEFRAFAGTLNFVKICGYVRMCLGLVEKACDTKRRPKWVAKRPVETSPIARGGEGQTEVCRLFYALGWTKGREKRVWGNVLAGVPGVTDAAIKLIKKEIMRLAKQYDEQA